MPLDVLEQIWTNKFFYPMHSPITTNQELPLRKVQQDTVTVILITRMCQPQSWYIWFLKMIMSNHTLQSVKESFWTNPQQRLHPLNGNDALKSSGIVNFKQQLHAEKVVKRTLKLITKARNKSKDSHYKSAWNKWNVASLLKGKLVHLMLCKTCYRFPGCA